MSRHNLVFIIALCMVVHCGAIVLTAAYYANTLAFRWTEPVETATLVVSARMVSIQHIQDAWLPQDTVLLVAMVSTLFMITRSQPRPRIIRWLLAAQAAVIFWGWLGVVMVPFALVYGIDGEWLGEHSLSTMVAGLWVIVACTLAIHYHRRIKRDPLARDA